MNKLTSAIVLSALVTAVSAHADEAPELAAHSHLDVEIDPTAYALGGFSVHVGAGRGHLRLDLGAFAMNVPSWLHGQADFDVSFWGTGAKLQWFPLAEQRALLVDVAAAYQRETISLRDSDAREREDVLGLSVDAGWRFWLPHGLYVTPWAGIDYDVGAHDIMFASKAFKAGAVGEFAAIHFGFRFR